MDFLTRDRVGKQADRYVSRDVLVTGVTVSSDRKPTPSEPLWSSISHDKYLK
jgi:hypothetical protein